MSEFDSQTQQAIEEGSSCQYFLNNVSTFLLKNAATDDIDDIGDISDGNDDESVRSLNSDFEYLKVEESMEVNIGKPYDVIAQEMVNLTPDGKIKKLVIKESYGAQLKPSDIAWVHYCFYLEGKTVPFDSTYSRDKEPTKLNMATEGVLIGFNLALLSMKVGEKAQFLIHHDLAFGELGIFERVPPKSTLFVTAHLLKATNYTKSKDKSFDTTYKECMVLFKEAEQFMIEKSAVVAKSKLSLAERKLTEVRMNSEEEDVKRKKLLVQVYLLLMKCCNNQSVSMPNRVCTAAREAISLMPSEVGKNPQFYYQRAIAYISFREFGKARKDLNMAKKLDPKDKEIDRQIERLKRKEVSADDSMISFDVKQRVNPSLNKNKSIQDYTQFEQITLEVLKEFKEGQDEEFVIPEGVSKEEVAIVCKICKALGLFLEKTIIRNRTTYSVHRYKQSKSMPNFDVGDYTRN